jgi:site-specific recombinase XerD
MLTYFTTESTAATLRCGSLAGQMDGFAAWLWERGYSQATAYPYLRVIADFSRFLERKDFGAGEVDESRAKEFLRHRRRRRLHRGDWAALRLLMKHMRETGVISLPSPAIVVDEFVSLERAFATYLLREKGLSPATEKNYAREIDAFLRHRFRRGPVTPSKLRTQDLYRFVSWRAQHVAPRRVKLTVTALRAFCRFLRSRGDIESDLASSVLTVSNWRLSTLPKSIPQEQVKQILAQCDRCTAVGRRNYAILLLLARLGLRASEVVALTLDDVDWDAGEFLVRGKGSRLERLPMPHDVGKALAAYLRCDRPRGCTTRRFFVRAKAPVVGFASAAAISTIVADAITRTGLDPPSRGAHLLRYSLATAMLRRGGSLAEIGELLRHRHPDTTALYAKVDLEALRSVAPAWPRAHR